MLAFVIVKIALEADDRRRAAHLPSKEGLPPVIDRTNLSRQINVTADGFAGLPTVDLRLRLMRSAEGFTQQPGHARTYTNRAIRLIENRLKGIV